MARWGTAMRSCYQRLTMVDRTSAPMVFAETGKGGWLEDAGPRFVGVAGAAGNRHHRRGGDPAGYEAPAGESQAARAPLMRAVGRSLLNGSPPAPDLSVSRRSQGFG